MTLTEALRFWISFILSDLMHSSNSEINNSDRFEKFKIHNINVNSLISLDRRHFLAIHLKKYQPDIVFITETCLNKRHRVEYSNYNFIRNDKTLNKRGTGILIKSEYNYKIIRNIRSELEHTAIQLESANGSSILAIALYAKQNSRFFDLGNIFSLNNLYDHIICGGDLNARNKEWLDYHNNTNGVRLYDWFITNKDLYGISLLNSSKPSREDFRSFSFIDMFIATNSIIDRSVLTIRNSQFNLLKIINYESDHKCVVFNIIVPYINRKESKFVFNFDKADWKGLSKQVSDQINTYEISVSSNLSNQEIDEAIVKINDIVLGAMDSHIEKVKVNPSTLIILNELALKLIKNKKTLRRKWFRSGCQDTLTKSLIDRISVIVKEVIQEQYSKKLEDMLKAIKPGNDLFKNIKRISKYGKKKSKITLIGGCDSSSQSADKLADHFENVHNSASSLISGLDREVTEYVEWLEENNNNSIMEFSREHPSDRSLFSSNEKYLGFASVSTISSFIKSRKNTKTISLNGISNYIIRRMPEEFIHLLTVIMNNAYNNSYFPSIWKKALILPIPKNGGIVTEIDKFRPISLLCSIGKIFECFIRENLLQFCDMNNVNNNLQFGFTKGRTTSQAVTLFLENMHDGYKKREPCLATTIDLRKAFDSVWVDGLLFKLGIFQCPIHLQKLLCSYLKNRSFTVTFNEARSSFRKISAGVPQGAILGPNLFNIYISDLPVDWENKISALMFADDILLYKSGKKVGNLISEMNEYLDRVSEYFRLWKLSVNERKCETILFRKSETYITKKDKDYKVDNKIVVRINNCRIKTVDRIKYLGIILQNKGSVIPHIDNVLKKANSAYYLLSGVFWKKSINSRVKEVCYKQLLKPILSYGFAGWSNCSSNQMKRIRSFERKILYKCLPFKEAYKYNSVMDYHSLISKVELYKKFTKFKRIDEVITEQFIRQIKKLEFIEIDRLKDITNIEWLNDRFINRNDRFFYKGFPPSYFYKLYIDGDTHLLEDKLTFFNRRYNSNDLYDFVYDLNIG